jgi:hypothetical protein
MTALPLPNLSRPPNVLDLENTLFACSSLTISYDLAATSLDHIRLDYIQHWHGLTILLRLTLLLTFRILHGRACGSCDLDKR